MINEDTKNLYESLYPRGINLLAFAFWWHYYAPPEWYHEHPADEIIRDAYEAWARTLPTPELDPPTADPTRFTLEEQLYTGYFAPKFAFDADSLEAAQDKARSWARYHSLPLNDVRVREATKDEAANWLRNEYIRYIG